MSIIRKRLSPEESREAAIEAARALLVEEGPQAVTLKAVAARIGRTHANLLHHFGSAADLQRALIKHLADKITAQIGAAAKRARETDQNPREVVDMTFDAFARGAGAMASWMILTGNQDALDPIAVTPVVLQPATEGWLLQQSYGRRASCQSDQGPASDQ